jgi:hypothetical protein
LIFCPLYRPYITSIAKAALLGNLTLHQSIHINTNTYLVVLGDLVVIVYKTIILPVVLYGYETWSLTLREEHRLRVFENRVIRRIFGRKRHEVT